MITNSLKLKKGDTVSVLGGKDKGKSGKIIEADRKTGRVVVEGVNIRHKFEKARPNKAGQKLSFPAAMHAGKVALICPHCGKTTRIGHKFLENGTKQRICKKCGGSI